MQNLMSTMPVCGAERLVYYRESGAKPYNVFAYGFAIALVELPWILLQVIVSGCFVLLGCNGGWMLELHEALTGQLTLRLCTTAHGNLLRRSSLRQSCTLWLASK